MLILFPQWNQEAYRLNTGGLDHSWWSDSRQQVALLLRRHGSIVFNLTRNWSRITSVRTSSGIPHASQEATIDTATLHLGSAVTQSVHMIGGVLLYVDGVGLHEHINAHGHTDSVTQFQRNLGHLFYHATTQYWNLVAQVQVLLHWSCIALSCLQVDGSTPGIDISVLETTRFETTELVKSSPVRIDYGIAWAVSATTVDDIDGSNLAVDNVELVFGRKTGTNEFFHNNLCGLEVDKGRDGVRVGRAKTSNQIHVVIHAVLCVVNQHKNSLIGMEVGGLDNNTVGVLWNDLLFQALTELFLVCHAAEDLRSGNNLINGKKVTGNLVFEVMEPVPIRHDASRVATELKRAILDKHWEGLARFTVVF